MSTVKHTTNFSIAQPIEVVFPLFSPEGEKRWVPGWDYENVTEPNELDEDYVFLTNNHDHASTDAIWVVKRYEPESYLVQFYKIEPEDKVAIIAVQCTQMDGNLTRVEVSYEYIGLNKKGNAFIQGFSSTVFETFIGEWKSLLESYFHHK